MKYVVIISVVISALFVYRMDWQKEVSSYAVVSDADRSYHRWAYSHAVSVPTRVSISDHVRYEDLPFKVVHRDDSTLAQGVTRVVQEGSIGHVEIMERVTFVSGEEVAREEVDRAVVEKPQNKIVAIGVEVKLGKKHTGQASWYAYKGCDCAANQWLPKGSRVKVTNTANGKSVVVKINDRGPFVAGRIIDLDVTAFEKIASKGAGVIDVVMEEVKE